MCVLDAMFIIVYKDVYLHVHEDAYILTADLLEYSNQLKQAASHPHSLKRMYVLVYMKKELPRKYATL